MTRASTQGISLFPAHQSIVDKVVAMLGLEGSTFSPAIQFIITDWARMRGLRDASPVEFAASSSVFIGYLTLINFAIALEQNEPVYVASYIETTHGSIEGQRTDHHYIMVTQPDIQNRVHYCRIPVVRLVYHNGIAFAPDYAEQLAKVAQVQGEVEGQLVGEGFALRRGMVALPRDLDLLVAEIG